MAPLAAAVTVPTVATVAAAARSAVPLAVGGTMEAMGWLVGPRTVSQSFRYERRWADTVAFCSISWEMPALLLLFSTSTAERPFTPLAPAVAVTGVGPCWVVVYRAQRVPLGS